MADLQESSIETQSQTNVNETFDTKSIQSNKNEKNLVRINNANKLSNVKCDFLEWSQCVTFHGFPKIFKEKTNIFMRLLWFFIFVTFASLTFYILVNNIISYYKYETVTSYQLINEQPSLFPTITICDSNAFTTRQAQSLIMNISKRYFNKDITKLSLVEYVTFAMSDLSRSVKLYVSDPKYGDENRKQLGFDLNKILIGCTFSDTPCKFNRDFHWYFHFDYGNCFQFNSGLNMSNQANGLKSVSFGSISNGLSLLIGPLLSQNEYPLAASKGIKVFIHNQTLAPNAYDNSISLKPGEETNIEIERQLVSNLPLPYGPCTDLNLIQRSEFYASLTKQSNRAYRQLDCLEMCLAQKPIEMTCQCYSTAFPPFQSLIPCTNSTQIECSLAKYQDVINNLASYASECAENSCPLECDIYRYETRTTSLEYPSLEFYNLLKNNLDYFNYTQSKYDIDFSTYDLYRQYFFSMNFYYSSASYTYVSQSPQMTLIGLLSNLGGSLGMFLGLSVFSVVEVFEILIRVIFSTFFSNKIIRNNS